MNKENFYKRRENIDLKIFEQKYDVYMHCNLCKNNITIDELKLSSRKHNLEICCNCEHKVFTHFEQENIDNEYFILCDLCDEEITDETFISMCHEIIFCNSCYQD